MNEAQSNLCHPRKTSLLTKQSTLGSVQTSFLRALVTTVLSHDVNNTFRVVKNAVA